MDERDIARGKRTRVMVLDGLDAKHPLGEIIANEHNHHGRPLPSELIGFRNPIVAPVTVLGRPWKHPAVRAFQRGPKIFCGMTSRAADCGGARKPCWRGLRSTAFQH